jgi:hypothetical protein
MRLRHIRPPCSKCADRAVESAENEAEGYLKESEEKVLAMQRDFEHLTFLHQVFLMTC